jgi:hypothetical protein
MAKLYKLNFALACLLFIASNVLAQNFPSSATRYKREFEIKGIAHPGNDLLQKIDIGKFDFLREKDKRVEVKDGDNQLILILYSENEIAHMKQESLRNATNIKTVSDVQYVTTPKTGRQ